MSKAAPMSPATMKSLQDLKDKATWAFKPKVASADKKLVAQAVAAKLTARSRKRAYMVAQGQMKGGFPKD